VIAAAGAVLDRQLTRVWECAAQQCLQTLDGHAAMVLTAWRRTRALRQSPG
jgi:hypothetical protein